MKPFLDVASQRLPQPRLANLLIRRPLWIARPQRVTSLGIFWLLLVYLLNTRSFTQSTHHV